MKRPLKLLLDTHAVLWWLAGSDRLSTAAHSAIANGECHVSVLSAVEVTAKKARGKLQAPEELFGVLPRQWSWLALLASHADAPTPATHRSGTTTKQPVHTIVTASSASSSIVHIRG